MAQSRRGSEQAHGLSKKRSVRSGWPLEGTTRKPALVGDRDGQVRGRHGPLEGTLAARAHAWQKAPRPQSHSPTWEGRAPSERGAGCGTLVVTADRSLGHSTGFPGPRLPVPTAPRSAPGAHTHSPRCAPSPSPAAIRSHCTPMSLPWELRRRPRWAGTLASSVKRPGVLLMARS